MLATSGKGKLGTGRELSLSRADILERASDLNIQEVANAKESPWQVLLVYLLKTVRVVYSE